MVDLFFESHRGEGVTLVERVLAAARLSREVILPPLPNVPRFAKRGDGTPAEAPGDSSSNARSKSSKPDSDALLSALLKPPGDFGTFNEFDLEDEGSEELEEPSRVLLIDKGAGLERLRLARLPSCGADPAKAPLVFPRAMGLRSFERLVLLSSCPLT